MSLFWRIRSSFKNRNRDVVQICVGLTPKREEVAEHAEDFAYMDFVKMIAFTARDEYDCDRKHNKRTYP